MTEELDDNPAEVVERELDLLARMPFVESEAELDQLLPIARHVDFVNGEHLFERGQPVDHIYLITQGKAELRAPGVPSWHVNDAGAVGFLDFLMERPYARTAIARGHVRALEIDAADYKEYLQDHVDFASQGLGVLAGDLFDEILASPDPAQLLARPPDLHPAGEHGGQTMVERLLLLSQVPAFSRASVQALANLAQRARVASYPAGREIITAGVRYDVISVLIRGQVELHHVGSAPIRRGPVDLLCHIAELTSVPRRVSVRAIEDTLVLRIDREELLDRMDEHFEVALSLYGHAARQRELLNNVTADRSKKP